MAGEYGADFFRTCERLVEHHAGTAGVGEDGVHACVFESLDKEIASHGGGRQLGSTLGRLLRGRLGFHFAHKNKS